MIALDDIGDATCRMSTATSDNPANVEAGAGYTIWEKKSSDQELFNMALMSVEGYQTYIDSDTSSPSISKSEYNGCWSVGGSITDPATSGCTYAASTTITSKAAHQYTSSDAVNFYSISAMRYTPSSGSTKHTVNDKEDCLGKCLDDPLDCVALSFAPTAKVSSDNCYTHHTAANRSPGPTVSADDMTWSTYWTYYEYAGDFNQKKITTMGTCTIKDEDGTTVLGDFAACT
jgi:hypothetical protein